MHEYNDTFFDYIEQGALASARAFVHVLGPALAPASVLDVGCGREVWLQAWGETGVGAVCGIDGDYVDVSKLRIPGGAFIAKDLARPFDLSRRFDVVQSLEVAEHLPPPSSEDFVASLVRHGDIVLFSAAVVGQGGENHVNERPLEFWRQLFAAHGYEAYDAVRPLVGSNRDVEPWYRNNAILYANREGSARLPASSRATRVPPNRPLAEGGSIAWRARRVLVVRMPRPVVNWIAAANARRVARSARRACK